MSRAGAALALLGLAAAGCGGGPAPGDGHNAPATDLPLVVSVEPVLGRLRALEVEIAGTRHDFLFDSAGGLTLVTPELAASLGCQPWGRFTAFRLSGERLDFQRCGDLSLKLGPLPLSAPSAIFDLMGLLPEGAPTLGGIVSLQTLAAHAVTLDLASDRIVVESADSLAARTGEMRPLEARFGRQAGGAALDLYLGIGTARGPLWFEVDSGNVDRLLLARHALGLLGLDPETPAGAEVQASLDLLGLGRLERPARVAEMIYDGVLDAATLEQLVISVDLRSGRAWGRRAPLRED